MPVEIVDLSKFQYPSLLYSNGSNVAVFQVHTSLFFKITNTYFPESDIQKLK